jgi:hypothetical protein
VIGDTKIEKVKILDDDPSARDSLKFSIADAKLTPIPIEGPIPNLENCVSTVTQCANAIICDHHLSKGTYATFDGAEAVALFYNLKFPAILCTAWGKAEIDSIRGFRQFIPSLIPPDKLDPESIVKGFETCINEFKGIFTRSRKPWRVMIRVEDVYEESVPKSFCVAIPGWNPQEIVRLWLNTIPAIHHSKIKAGSRFYAVVNKGADNQDDLYFRDFEFD